MVPDYSGCSAGAHDILRRTRLYVGSGSYTLLGSPCIDVIPAASGDPVGEDIDGTSRVYPKDMGCYENTTLPAVTTTAASAISSISASTGGSINPLGTPNPTHHGVCWNTTGMPTISDDSTDEGAVSAIGLFSYLHDRP